MARAFQKPPRLLRIVNGDLDGPRFDLYAPFNPESVEVDLSAEYVEHGPLGLSHGTSNYIRTPSREFRFELVVNALALRNQGYSTPLAQPSVDPMAISRLFAALVVPTRQGGRPPTVLLLWPHLMAVRAVILEAHQRIEEFSDNGEPKHYTIEVAAREVRTVFADFAHVRSAGFATGEGAGARPWQRGEDVTGSARVVTGTVGAPTVSTGS